MGRLLSIFALLAGLLPEHAFTAVTARDQSGWNLVWSDEFDHDGAPDPAKWSPETGRVRNGEAQYYTNRRPENARVEHGCLVLEARKESFEGADYTSASLTTARSAAWTYGRIEVRAKIPSGRGLWPAIWMLGDAIKWKGWPACGEIDIMENVGFDPDRIHCTVHTGAYNHVKGTQKGASLNVITPSADFHVYAAEWTAEQIVISFDGKEVLKFKNEQTGFDAWPFSAPHYLLLNVAVGGGWGGQKGIDESVFPQRMLVDYVRVYQRPVTGLRPADRPAAVHEFLKPSTKKGVGHWGKRDAAAIDAVGAAWYYNWAPRVTLLDPTRAGFVPMIWGRNNLNAKDLGDVRAAQPGVLLGFNEPDNKGQADMPVAEILEAWPKLEATGAKRLGSPAGWTDEFMVKAREKKLKVDVLCLHWYWDITAPGAVGGLHAFLEAHWKAWGLPIWLTEYSGGTFEGYRRKATVDDNARFARDSILLMESLPYVERYAWFATRWSVEDEAYSTVTLVDDAGALTPVGLAYRDTRPAVNGGLAFKSYDGDWDRLPDFSKLTPVSTGVTWGIDTAGRMWEKFGVVLDGWIEIPRDGVWTFTVESGDGSALFIGGAKVVDNDGRHAAATRSGSIGLARGRHRIRVEYFESGKDGTLGALWEGPGTPRQPIPGSVFFRP